MNRVCQALASRPRSQRGGHPVNMIGRRPELWCSRDVGVNNSFSEPLHVDHLWGGGAAPLPAFDLTFARHNGCGTGHNNFGNTINSGGRLAVLSSRHPCMLHGTIDVRGRTPNTRHKASDSVVHSPALPHRAPAAARIRAASVAIIESPSRSKLWKKPRWRGSLHFVWFFPRCWPRGVRARPGSRVVCATRANLGGEFGE
jgi:hypothetical protein